MKRRLLRITGIAGAVLVFTGYFAFSTFLFSPLEGSFELDVSTLIPRDVDYFFAKAQLSDDFDEFPRLAFADELAATQGGSTFLRHEFEPWKEEQGIAEGLAQLDEALAGLPVAVQPLTIFGGSDLALAGYFQGTTLETADWAAYGRTNWTGKLAIALLGHAEVLDLESQGLTVVEDGKTLALSGPSLERTLYLTRVRDVLIVGTRPDLVASAHTLENTKGQDSLGQSARYYDHIEQNRQSGDELEIFLDYRTLSEEMQLTGRWPEPDPENFFSTLMSHVFQSGTLKELVGTTRFQSGVAMDLHAELSSELLTPFQKKLYRARGFDSSEAMNDAARFASRDAGLFVYLHCDMQDLLEIVFQSLNEDQRFLLDDLARDVWGYPDARRLIEEFGGSLHDRIAIVARPNDYPDDPDGPPHDDQAVFAWAMVGWLKDSERLERVRKQVVAQPSKFGIAGRDPGESGVWSNEVRGFQVFEYWSPFLPGTGHLATVSTQDNFILGNSHKLLGEMLVAYNNPEEAPRPPLSLREDFRAVVSSGLPHANLIVWMDPRNLGPTLREMARDTASNEVQIDWTLERPRIEAKILKENFPGKTWDSLGDDERASADRLYENEAQAFQEEFREQHVPALYAKYERSIVYSELFAGLLLQLGFEPNKMELALRARMPLDG